jgi:RNA polymerase sigma factor (TIGR02999 family)
VSTTEFSRSEDLLPLLYDELRKLARALMAHLPAGETLQPTALVHEAYLRLVGNVDPLWNGRGHFFGAAAQAMRRILVEQARRKAAQKRGGGRTRVHLDDVDLAMQVPVDEMLELDRALDRLREIDEQAAEIVMLRFFAGLSTRETAACMEISVSTVERRWRSARALLYTQLRDPAFS